MKARLIIIVMLSLSAISCTSADYKDYRLFPREYVSNEEYDSIYHYGYNQGCESALNTKGQTGMDYLKDVALDGSNTRFNEGWDAGNKACKEGVRRGMYDL
ncbi:hypothetical protein [Photobacterium lipolyticum]|uniref:Lipoprotein n=1 Tax=Photobacterium lipolyticum TaxID=266810 RepID=A0A2T3MYR4_9GAMM|nr:hypothetical protein [Photobacterium lipolyticum]PSW05132.1 hypothetical protein C9I89_10090 [Photobacterium lipolyticum]